MARHEKSKVVLGRAIRELRIKRDLTQEELAQRSGITVGHLSKIERGVSNPTWETVVGIAAALGVTMSELAQRAH